MCYIARLWMTQLLVVELGHILSVCGVDTLCARRNYPTPPLAGAETVLYSTLDDSAAFPPFQRGVVLTLSVRVESIAPSHDFVFTGAVHAPLGDEDHCLRARRIGSARVVCGHGQCALWRSGPELWQQRSAWSDFSLRPSLQRILFPLSSLLSFASSFLSHALSGLLCFISLVFIHRSSEFSFPLFSSFSSPRFSFFLHSLSFLRFLSPVL